MSSQPRDTQRVPKSCTECTRRKVKCNKKIPCEPCLKRGDHLSCTREIVRVNGRIKIALDSDPLPINNDFCVAQLRAENERLRAQIKHMEVLAGEIQSPGNETARLSASLSAHNHSSDTVDDLLSAFENLHIPGPTSTAIFNISNPSHIPSNYLISLLPSSQISEFLVCYSIETLGWIHCAVNVPIFLAEHQAFWNGIGSQTSNNPTTPSWLALYFAMIAVGVFFWADDDAGQFDDMGEESSGLLGAKIHLGGGMSTLARSWYDASLHYLASSDFIGHPKLVNIQAMAVLNLLHRNLGESQRDYLLLGLAINSGRVIGMDKLGCESEQSGLPIKNSTWDDQKSRELGRRLWWTLVICDWMNFSTRHSSIDPRSFNTRLSVMADQSHSQILLSTATSSTLEDTELPSPLQFHVLAGKLAQILYIYTNSRAEIPYERVRKALDDIDLLSQALPPHLKYHSIHSSKLPTWLILQQLQALFLLQVNRIRLCLITLPHFLDNYDVKYDVRECGLAAANSIIDAMQDSTPSAFSKLWGTAPCISAAGIYLILDLICFRESKANGEILEQSTRIQSCIHILLQMERSDLERAQVLGKLWEIGESWPANRLRNKHTLFQIMESARKPGPTSHSSADFMATKNVPINPVPSDTDLDFSSITPDLGLGDGTRTGRDWGGFPMNLDFMEFDSLDSYQAPGDSNWDLNSFLGIPDPRGPY